MAFKAGNILVGDVVERTPKATSSYLIAVQQFKGAGCGVARICKGLVPGFLAFLVKTVEGAEGHKYFTPYLEVFRPAASFKGMGDVGYLADVYGNIVPNHSVAPGKGGHKTAVTVCKGNTCTVKFKLATICK